VVGKDAPPALLDSLLYTLSFHRFGQLHAGGFDRVRREEIGRKELPLEYFQEAYTSTNWLLRIYKVRASI
jgi:dolichyl-diphosphooligosaccharide--protein glycosyltransferase